MSTSISTDPRRRRQRRALWLALLLNAGFMGAEVVGGIVFNSLALLADAAHMFSDVVAVAIALLAHGLMMRPASARHTYGLQRAEVLGALINGVVLIAIVGVISFQAVDRLSAPQPVEGLGLLIVAGLGLVVNLAAALVIKRAEDKSLNMRGAFIHMVSDAAGSVAVIVAAAAVLLWGATWVDPLASLGIAILVLWATWGLLTETVRVLMEAAPKDVDVGAVENALRDHPEVESVHHLHVWNIASDVPALSAHVVLEGEKTLHQAQERGGALKRMLHDRFGIEHSTLEVECHPCVEESTTDSSRGAWVSEP